MNTAHQDALHRDNLTAGRGESLDIVSSAMQVEEAENASVGPHSHGIFHFFTELRRRRVCRAATVYSVALWLICQVVELVFPALGLPTWTLRLVIVFGLLGFPIALILSWLIQITPQGFVIEGSADSSPNVATAAAFSRPVDRAIDCSLVIAALVIGTQLATGALSTATAAASASSQTMVVVPFRVASGNDAVTFSEGLVIELQHEIATQTDITVIAPRDPYDVEDSLRLTGAVSVGENRVRVTATLIDNDDGAVTWSQVFARPRSDSLTAPVEFAQAIVAALPLPYRLSAMAEGNHATL